jgi:hypothetical protein
MNNGPLGFCVYCGRLLQQENHILTKSGRLVCDKACNNGAALQEQAMEFLRSKTQKGGKVSSWFCYAAGLGFLLFAIPHLFLRGPLFFLGLFLILLAFIFFGAGYGYAKIGKNK